MDPREDRAVRRALVPTIALCLAGGLVVGLAACTTSPDSHVQEASTGSLQVRDLDERTVALPATDPARLALAASQLAFERAPLLIVASLGDDAAAPVLTAVATALHAPVLLADGPDDRAVRSEAERLGALAAVVVEQAPVATDDVEPSAADGAARAAGLRVVRLDPDAVVADGAVDGASTGAPGGVALDRRSLEDLRDELGQDMPAPEPTLMTEVLALVDPKPGQEAALATLRAAGAVTDDVPGGDPGASGDAVQTLADAQALTVIGVGPGFADAPTFAWQVAAAVRGQLLPTGSQRVLPARFDAVTARVSDQPERILAATDDDTDPDSGDGPRVPTLVLRASVRQWTAGANGTYLRAESLDALTPLVDAARRGGRYVVLELEGGSVTLVDQVRALEPLLARGGVGVLVHPEQRRSGAGRVRGGAVEVGELQAVVDYLAELVTQKSLPQTLLAVRSLDSAVDGVAGLTTRPQVALVDAATLDGDR
ncbi:hypothetical protein [Xylanimonas ulmi]|uniref:Uncharacterized protein n=1 Tax=Xylanimonas ulmi TaxID=228973 RepID=A0A4Q7M215_9MICO|nr:hypothetical protein [Xylanibacterium ulmi]RZS61895.1 hypothetical protein EV386_2208 [Xylanibacterium ulmi]